MILYSSLYNLDPQIGSTVIDKNTARDYSVVSVYKSTQLEAIGKLLW